MGKDSSVISDFFVALSKRAYKENDLSDVTFALCEADAAFKKFFLDFFFGVENLDASEVVLEREVAYPDGSRPDFVIRTGAEVCFVEVKIWDCNHHFAQYKNTLCGQEKIDPKEIDKHFGYIANYTIVKEQLPEADQRVYEVMKSRVKTWKDFVGELKKNPVFDDSTIVKAYVDYLMRVCSYDDFTVKADDLLDVGGFKTVETLYNTISDIVEKKLDGVVPYNRSSRQFQSMHRLGRYFEYTKFKETEDSNGDSVWGWIGAVYEKVDNTWVARVCVEFENTPGWGEKVCKKHNVKDGVLRFYYDHDDEFKKLQEFVEDVLDGKIQPGNAKCGKNFNKLLVMKALPFAIENYFYGKLTDEWMIEKGYDSDEENPTSHCGRYFKLRRTNEPGDMSSGRDDIPQGWVGVMFDERAHFGREFDNVPVFVVQLPKCEGIFELNSDWLQDQCSKYWWSKKLNPMPVDDLANAFKACLKGVLNVL